MAAVSLLLFAATSQAVLTAEEAKKQFAIHGADAITMLKQFAAQSGCELIYSAKAVEGVRPHELRGEFSPLQALDLMLAGTPLSVREDEKTGAFAIVGSVSSGLRQGSSPPENNHGIGTVPSKTVFNGNLALSPAASSAISQVAGQTASTAATAKQSGNGQEIVKMSQFEVSTTQGHGYTSSNAATAFLSDEPLMDIPQGVIVVTNDMIKDIAETNSTDILRYVGAFSVFQGENVGIRGVGVGYPLVDGLPENEVFQDSAVIDSYEVIKGAAQALYLNSGPNGFVLKTTKRPLPYDYGEVDVKADEWGLFRTVVDVTGPMGEIGQAKLSYRFIGVYQHDHTYFENVLDNRLVLFPEIQVQYHNTTARVYYNFEKFTDKENGQSILTPSGALYTGAGRKSEYFPPNDMNYREQHTVFAEVLQKLSENWESRFAAQYWDQNFFGPGAQVVSYDWDEQTGVFEETMNNRFWRYWTATNEYTGKYSLGPPTWEMTNHDTFGFVYLNNTSKNEFWGTTTYLNHYGWDGNGNQSFALANDAAFNAIQVPPVSSYYPPPSIGNESQSYSSDIYWQHSISVIPNWLDLTGAFTWADVHNESIGNVSALPWNATVVSVAQWLHRLGAVLHLTKQVSFYALDSNTFSAPGAGTLTINNQLLPPGLNKARELGMKTSFWDGKLSSEFGWFRVVKTNAPIEAGAFPNGNPYFIAASSGVVSEGVDGDVSLALAPGWQLVGTFYAGHERQADGITPLTSTYDNSWSLFTRYDFGRVGPLHRLAVGGGVATVGGQWVNDGGLTDAPGLPANGYIKMQQGSMLNAFVVFDITRHWSARVDVENILNQAFGVGSEGDVENIDPSDPRTFSFQLSYRY
jgi:outer membrane receptor for ferric coprogen and ferric-rhodotorulic acid